MLSPGRYYEHVPTELEANLRFRLALLDAAEGDRDVQAELWRMCKDDILFWIRAFVFQFNPSKAKQGGAATRHPFIPFPAQERVLIARPETHKAWRPHDRGLLWCYENDKTGVVEKSRWQGMSWLLLIVESWLLIFHDDVQVLNISRNEGSVDDGTKDSLYWKVRYIHDHLPTWMLGRVESVKLFFDHKRTNSQRTGTATTRKAGVGGRASWLSCDEFPEIDEGQIIREKTALTADCRIFVGTHLGVGTPFQMMCDPRLSPEIVRMRLHWTDNPEQYAGAYEFDPANPAVPILLDKNYKHPADYKFVLDGTPVGGPRPGVRSPWYDRKCVEIGDSRAIAMNLDISPEGAAKQFFDPLRVRHYMEEYCRNPIWVGDVQYDRAGKFERLVANKSGFTKVWVQPNGEGRFPAARYTVGVDISMGQGASNSCIAVINGDTSMKVLEFANSSTEPKDLARLAVAICDLFRDGEGGPAKMGWDSCGPTGNAFRNAVLALSFRNFCYDGEYEEQAGPVKALSKPGWYGDPDAKYNLIDDYKRALMSGTLIDRSQDCLEETLSFETDKGSRRVVHAKEMRNNDPTGARENHADLVIATGIAWMMAKEMAAGGKRSLAAISATIQPNTVEWLEALSVGTRSRDRSEVYT